VKNWFEQLRKKVIDIRERESAQRDFVRAIYNSPSRLAADYEVPAYLRKARSGS
jgi:hypothetical protein